MRWMTLAAILLAASIIEGGPTEAATSAAPAPTAVAAAKQPRPLCRRNFVPVKRGRGYHCVRLRVPRATSDVDAIRAVTAAEPRWAHKYAAAPAVEAAMKAADTRLLTAMKHALSVVARLKLVGVTQAAADASRTPVAQAAASASATYDTGWKAQADAPGWEGRESGSVEPASGQPPGTTRTTNVEERGPDGAENSRSWTSTVKLSGCPDASGKVRGTASIIDEHSWQQRGADGVLYRSEFKLSAAATVTAPVSDGARVQPYDLKITLIQQEQMLRWEGRPFYKFFPASERRVRKLAFLDLKVPLDQSGPRGYYIGAPITAAQTLLMYGDVLLGRLYPQIGSRLRAIESDWRAHKQCVKVIATPSMIKGLTAGHSKQVVVQARAGGKDITSRIDGVSHAGGTLSPGHATTRLGAPARFTFKATSKKGGSLLFTATSRHGIGEAKVSVIPTGQKMVASLTRDWTWHDAMNDNHGHDTFKVTFVSNPNYDAGKSGSHMWIPQSGTWTSDGTEINRFNECKNGSTPTGTWHASGSRFQTSGGLDYVAGSKLYLEAVGAEPYLVRFACGDGSGWNARTGAGASVGLMLPNPSFSRVLLSGRYTLSNESGTETVTWTITPG